MVSGTNGTTGPLFRRYLDTTPGAFEAMTEITVQGLKRAIDSEKPMTSLRGCDLLFRVLGLYGRE